MPKKQKVKKDPFVIEREEMEKISKVWVNIVRRDIPKHHRNFTTFQRKQQKRSNESKGNGCFFGRAVEHVKKHYTNYHAWRAKKGMLLNLVCSEVNLALVPRHTWWIDFGVTTQIIVSM